MEEKFLSACSENEVSEVRELLNRGADVNWRDQDGYSGLHWAAVNNYGELLELLLDQREVEVNITNNEGETPMMMACFAGRDKLLERLCQLPHLQLNSGDRNGWTGLHWAVENDRIACVQVLTGDDRVDCNIQNIEGDSPLMKCLKLERREMANIFLHNPRINLNLTDLSGRYLEEIARDLNLTETLEILETFTTVRLRMIQQDSLLYRQSNTPPSLMDISRDSVLVTIITSNTEERKVKPLVDRLEGIIPRRTREILN